MMMMMIVMMMMVMMISPFVSSVGKQSYSHFVPQELPHTTVFCQYCHTFYHDNYHDDDDDDKMLVMMMFMMMVRWGLFISADRHPFRLSALCSDTNWQRKEAFTGKYILLQYRLVRSSVAFYTSSNGPPHPSIVWICMLHAHLIDVLACQMD